MEELARFHTARNHFRNYLKARRELDSRLLRLKPSHKARKAFERLAGVGKFQCRADDCACNFAAAHGGFPDFETPIDVLSAANGATPNCRRWTWSSCKSWAATLKRSCRAPGPCLASRDLGTRAPNQSGFSRARRSTWPREPFARRMPLAWPSFTHSPWRQGMLEALRIASKGNCHLA